MRLFLAASLALACLLPAAAGARPFTAKDLATQERIGDPRVSPDGRWVAYTVRTTDWDGNKGVQSLWLLDRTAAGAKPVAVTEDEKAPASPRWSADGKWLYFLSGKSGSTQVWRVAADRTGRAQITSLPVDVSFFRLAPDGRSMIVGADVYPDCPDLACTKGRNDARAKVKSSGQLFVDGALPRAFDRYEDELFTNLFAVRLDAGAPAEGVRLTPGLKADVDGAGMAVSRDGRTVWFSALPSGASGGAGPIASLYAVPADGSAAPARLAPDSPSSDSRPVVSPDGRTLAYVAEAAPVMIYQRSTLMLRDLKTGATRPLGRDLDISVQGLAWSPDGRALLLTTPDTGQVPLLTVDVASGKATELVADGSVSGFDAAGEVIVYARESLTSPVQLFETVRGRQRQLTEGNKAAMADTPMSDAEQFSFAGWNGETVYGYIVKPHGWQPGKTYPVAYLIHGGPHGSFGNAWSYRWNPQVWAGMGYAVVMVDFHGSAGYGEAFAQSIVGHWGDRPLEDLQKGWAFALDKYDWLDGDRACALGGSYGGYMVAWIASQWQTPWKCLVNHAGLFDMRGFAYASDIPAFAEQQNGGLTWADPASVEKFNPALHVKDWKTPMLVIHGARDYRVPLDQGIGAYTANQRLGVPTEYLHFPDENHWVLKPQNSVQWYATVEAWMARWTKEK